MLQLLRNRQQAGLNPATRGITHYEQMPLTGFEPQTIDMNDAQVVLTRSVGNPAGTLITSSHLLVDPNSAGGSEDLLLPLEAHCEGIWLNIINTGGENIRVRDDADVTTIASIPPDYIATLFCDGTTWRKSVSSSIAAGQATNTVAQPLIAVFDASAGLTGDLDITVTQRVMVADAWVVMSGAGAAGDTFQVKETANAITDVLSVAAAADTDIVRFTQIDDAERLIPGGGTLRLTGASAATGWVYVLLIPTDEDA